MTAPLEEAPDQSQDEPAPTAAGPRRFETRLEQGLVTARFLVVVPVVFLVLSSLGAFAYGAYVFADGIGRVVPHPVPVGDKIGLFLLIIDLFLIGATLLIAAIGFYELFVHRLGSERMPAWLAMTDLNDLKARVISMIVLVVAVSFVELVVDEVRTGLEVLEIGGGIGAVIVSLTAYLRFGSHRRSDD